MRKTKAMQIVLGLVCLFGLFLLSISFHFQSLNWLLSKFFDSIFILVLVLFQDQIKSGLASLFSTSGLLGGIKKDRFRYDIEEVIHSVEKCVERNRGALIVLQRDQGLLNFMATGTKLGTDINSDVLLTLLAKDSPLHDGAIIVGSGKILAAGVFLPLSKSWEGAQEYGSRHRAAMGLSEISDAVILTVSEENKSIHLFYKSKCYKCIDENELRDYLLKFWASPRILKTKNMEQELAR